MGCDIHVYVEKRVDGQWRAADKYSDEDGIGPDVSYDDRVYVGRNYRLFSVLAGVRKHDMLPVIAEPRDLPEDVSPEVRAASDSWGVDGHSHSWLTLRELLDFDWTQECTFSTTVTGQEFARWSRYDRGQKNEPDWSFGSRGGPGIVTVPMAEMDARLAALTPQARWADHPEWERLNVPITWEQPVARSVGSFLSETVFRLVQLAGGVAHADDLRIVFWFDN
jgi:hypothetical protein